MSSKMFMSFFLQSQKIKFLWKTFQDFSPYSGLQWWPTISRSKIQLQRAPHDPSRGIRALSSKTISHFLNFFYIYTLFNHKCWACSSSAMLVFISWCWKGYVWRRRKHRLSVYKANMQKKVKCLLQKKVKQRCQMVFKLEEKVRWSF